MTVTMLTRIHHAARYGRIILSLHAQEEAEEAGARWADIKSAILTATVAKEQAEGRVRLEGGTDLEGEPLTVVVREVQPGLLVVTVF